MSDTTKILAVALEALDVIRTATEKSDIQAQTVVTFLQVAMRGEVSMGELEKVVGVTQSSVSRNVAALSIGRPGAPGLGLLDFYEDPENRRRRIVRVNAEGRALVKKIVARCERYLAPR